MPDTEDKVDTAVLKSARAVCHQAKDKFYECLDHLDSEAGGTVPKACYEQRVAFEKACKASWVKHFDALRDKEVRLLQTLHGNINTSASAAVGTLAGKPDPVSQA